MKPIIWDMNEISESTEVYESRPNPWIAGTIYLILAIFLFALIWMRTAKMDVVIKADGRFRGKEETLQISNTVSGTIISCKGKDGDLVKKGDLLFRIKADALDTSMKTYKQERKRIKNRIEILEAYQKFLDGDTEPFQSLTNNPYKQEFQNRLELLNASIDETDENLSGQKEEYQKSVNSMEAAVLQSQQKIDKLNQAKSAVQSRSNPFDGSDAYYNSLVNSYISSYNSLCVQYDNQLAEIQQKINDINAKIEAQDHIDKEENVKEEADISGGATILPTEVSVSADELGKEKTELEQQMTTSGAEKEKALQSLELEQQASIEQQIATEQSNILSVQASLTTAKAQLESLAGKDAERAGNQNTMAEKNNVAEELLTYAEKQKECEANIKTLEEQNGNCEVKATATGYLTLGEQISEGTYVQQGTELGQILPKKTGAYYAEVYIENSDIGKVKEGQEVKFEVAAFPSSEYGYFKGTILSISKDIKVDQNSGNSYYLAKVSCESTTIKNKAGKKGDIKNGMACQAKVVVERQTIWQYLMKKLDFWD